MLAAERIDKIYSLFLDKKTLTIKELAEAFNVTTQTIRRDLKKLEDGGIINVSYGGANLNQSNLYKSNVEFNIRQSLTVTEKVKIADLAQQFIQKGDSIFLDNSSTIYALTKKILDVNLNIITNAILVSYAFLTYTNINLIMIGGKVDITNKCTNDSVVTDTLDMYYFDKSFISCSALSLENGLMDSNINIGNTREQVIKKSDTVYLLVDHTKFDKTSLLKIADIDAVDYIITDKKPSKEWLEYCKSSSIKLIYPEN